MTGAARRGVSPQSARKRRNSAAHARFNPQLLRLRLADFVQRVTSQAHRWKLRLRLVPSAAPGASTRTAMPTSRFSCRRALQAYMRCTHFDLVLGEGLEQHCGCPC